MKVWLAVAFVTFAGCSKKSSESGGDNAKGPGEFAAWMPKDAAKAWEGAWLTRMHLQSNKKGYTSMAGEPVALEIKGSKVTAFGGEKDQELKLSFESPCVAQFEEPITEGSMKGGSSYISQLFVIQNGELLAGDDAAGYRKGKSAIVCSGSSKVYILDDKGACKYWKREFREWQAWPDTKCAWSQKDGKDVLTIGEGDSADVLTADGDVLTSEQYREHVKRAYHTKAKDFADAKAQVTAKIKADDPGEQAKAKGGVAGKTDTVLSLIATLSSDPSLKGKQVELTVQYAGSSSSTSNGKTTHSVSLVDSKDLSDFSIPCRLDTAPPEGLVQYDKVTAKGTVTESFGKPDLEGCTITKTSP